MAFSRQLLTRKTEGKAIKDAYLTAFAEYPRISRQIEHVFNSLPEDIKSNFLADTNFQISLDDCEPGKGRTVVMPLLGPRGTSRCIVLKPRLEQCSLKFSRYIIAHEFAHAYLHNGGWGEITDREEAADALALHWGFPKQSFEWI